jgi:hypothetical protein
LVFKPFIINPLGMNQRFMQGDDPSLPPSEQQVKEPNLYQGSSIPSRSFRILQNAMNAAENAGTLSFIANY